MDPELVPGDGDYRQQGVPEGMANEHQRLRQALGTGRPDVVFPQHLQHGGTGYAGRKGHVEVAQGQGGGI